MKPRQCSPIYLSTLKPSLNKADLKDYTWDEQLQKITTEDDQQEGVDFLRGLHGKKLTPWETVADGDFNMNNDQEITFELDKSFAFSIPNGGAGFDDS